MLQSKLLLKSSLVLNFLLAEVFRIIVKGKEMICLGIILIIINSVNDTAQIAGTGI